MDKKITWILISVLMCFTGVIIFWLLAFHGPLSKNIADWGAFGGYVGGLLSPLVATFALIAFLYTVKQQQKQIKLLAEQSAKEDLWHVIEKIEKDFENTLKRYPIVDTSGKSYNCFDLISNRTLERECKMAMVQKEKVEKIINNLGEYSKALPQELYTYEMFATAAQHLSMLKDFAEEYSRIAGNKALLIYFHEKYKIPYQRFVEQGYTEEPWTI